MIRYVSNILHLFVPSESIEENVLLRQAIGRFYRLGLSGNVRKQRCLYSSEAFIGVSEMLKTRMCTNSFVSRSCELQISLVLDGVGVRGRCSW